MNAITYISQLSDVLRPSTSLQDVTQSHCVLPITLDVLRHAFTLRVLLKQMAITVFLLALWSIRERSTYLDTTVTSDFSTIMCHFTVSASSQFSRTERLLDNLCSQMEFVLLRISEVSARLGRATPQSPASVSLALRLQVLQGVYSQMYEVASRKAQELEELHISV